MTEPHQVTLRSNPFVQPGRRNLWLAAGALALFSAAPLTFAQTAPTPAPAPPATIAPPPAPQDSPAPKAVEVAPLPAAAQPAPNRSVAYFHAALANTYADMATNYGRQEYFSKAVDEYKLAINADPDSALLSLGLGELYFRQGRVKEAISTIQILLKKDNDNLDAHKLLGRIYLRSLGQDQSSDGQPGPGSQVLDLAIAEFLKIVSLEPKGVESHLLLGQLYSVKHDTAKAESEFKTALSLEPASEDVILNLARLYADNGDLKRSAELIAAVPAEDRTTKMELALGTAYEQLKENKKAIAAYQRSEDLEPENLDAVRALGQALLSDNQLDAALKQFKMLTAGDPEDVAALNRISEIERRQGKYTQALATIRRARAKQPDSLEAGYNEGLLLDVLGRYDEAVTVYKQMDELTGHANGAYTQDEKANRSIFLERLGAVYNEQNKTAESVAAYQKMVDLGGEFAKRGFQGQVDAYRDAKMFDRATAICQQAVAANPNDRDLKLLLAWQLADTGKLDEGLTIANSLLKGTAADKDVDLRIADIQMRMHHWKEAEEALAKAEPYATKDDDKADFYFRKGSLAESEKRYDQAEEFFHKVLVLEPDNAMTLNNLGYMLADKTTRYTDALKFIRKAVELEPMNGAYLDSLGWVYFKLGQFEPAEDNLRKAVERSSSDPSVHDHLGDLYEKTGRVRLAAAQWEISLQEFGKSPAADAEPIEVAKVQKKLEGARVKLAKQESSLGDAKQQ